MNIIDNSKRMCPLCGLKIKDFLKHVRIQHEIGSTEELESKMNTLENKKTKQAKFAAYIEELKQKEKNKEISADEYRELITKWQEENK